MNHVTKTLSVDSPGNRPLSLYVLFSHFRPRDATRGNSFFQMSSYARANVRITNDKNKRQIPMRASRGLKWENKMCKLERSVEAEVNSEMTYLDFCNVPFMLIDTQLILKHLVVLSYYLLIDNFFKVV